MPEMSCPSTRLIAVGGEGVLGEAEEVQCFKHFGHHSSWHTGILEDGSGIQWMGSPGYDVPAARSGT